MTKVVVVYSFVSKKSTNHKGQDDGDVQRGPLWGQGEDLCWPNFRKVWFGSNILNFNPFVRFDSDKSGEIDFKVITLGKGPATKSD